MPSTQFLTLAQHIRSVQKRYGRVLHFPPVSLDPYVAGIIAAKLGMDEWLLDKRWCLKPDCTTADWQAGERRELFLTGVKESQKYEMELVAWDIRCMWKRNPELFQIIIRMAVQPWYYRRIMDAIQKAKRPKYQNIFMLLRGKNNAD